MKAIELFAGAGGLSIGLKKAGFEVVLANEIEPDFASTLALNHPHTTVLNADIHEIDFVAELDRLNIPSVTLVSGGPPCQGFSTVGSKNQQDPRNSLFYEFIRVVNSVEPDYVLFENVSGFQRLYGGEAHARLLEELAASHYRFVSGVLEASDFGLPQNRQRTIVLAWRSHLPPVQLPTPTHWVEDNLFGLPRKLHLMEAISDLPPLVSGGSADAYLRDPANEYQRQLRQGVQVLTEHNASNYGEKMQEILRLIPPGGTVTDLPAHLQPESCFGNTYARLHPDRPAPTITRNFGTPSSSRCVHPFQNRALSTREGARLQGFPDSYRFHGSKCSRNLQIGNAVPPIFGEVIAREILRSATTAARQTQLRHPRKSPASA